MIVLATKSKARRRLFKKCKRNAVFAVSDIDESRFENESVEEYLLRVSFLKALKFAKDGVLSIGADTVIYFEGKVIGKPKNRDEAFEILKALSGRYHRVYTAVSIIGDGRCIRFVDTAVVKVDRIDDGFLNRYLDTGEYIGRAAGYAIQGRARYFMRVAEGDITTVIGLPMKRLCRII